MKKIVTGILIFLTAGMLLSGCGQEKVLDTDFIRLQNKVKDIENIQKQKNDELARLTQKVSDISDALDKQAEQMSSIAKNSEEVTTEEFHPVIIQDVKVVSEKMDDKGRIWGPFTINVTLYNGTDSDISDQLAAMIMRDSTSTDNNTPQVQTLLQPFEIKAKESKTISIQNIQPDQPSKRLNIIVKLLEQAPTSVKSGVQGKATWVIVPTVIFPPGSKE